MEKITFDSGIREFEINENGVLRFNPGDPNVYARLLDALDDIKAVEKELVDQSGGAAQADGAAVLRLITQADKRMKEILTSVFGPENDFNEIMGGVNAMAVCDNGERAITNLLNVLMPIVQEGAERCAKQQADIAVAEARAARSQREKK